MASSNGCKSLHGETYVMPVPDRERLLLCQCQTGMNKHSQLQFSALRMDGGSGVGVGGLGGSGCRSQLSPKAACGVFVLRTFACFAEIVRR